MAAAVQGNLSAADTHPQAEATICAIARTQTPSFAPAITSLSDSVLKMKLLNVESIPENSPEF